MYLITAKILKFDEYLFCIFLNTLFFILYCFFNGFSIEGFGQFTFFENFQNTTAADVYQPDSVYCCPSGELLIISILQFALGQSLAGFLTGLTFKIIGILYFKKIAYLLKPESAHKLVLAFSFFPPAKLYYISEKMFPFTMLAIAISWYLYEDQYNQAIFLAMISMAFSTFGILFVILIPLWKPRYVFLWLKSLVIPFLFILNCLLFRYYSGDFLAYFHNNYSYYNGQPFSFPFHALIIELFERYNALSLVIYCWILALIFIGGFIRAFNSFKNLKFKFDKWLMFFYGTFLIYLLMLYGSINHYGAVGLHRWSIILFPVFIYYSKEIKRNEIFIPLLILSVSYAVKIILFRTIGLHLF